jgi:hypothetical protein
MKVGCRSGRLTVSQPKFPTLDECGLRTPSHSMCPREKSVMILRLLVCHRICVGTDSVTVDRVRVTRDGVGPAREPGSARPGVGPPRPGPIVVITDRCHHCLIMMMALQVPADRLEADCSRVTRVQRRAGLLVVKRASLPLAPLAIEIIIHRIRIIRNAAGYYDKDHPSQDSESMRKKI